MADRYDGSHITRQDQYEVNLMFTLSVERTHDCAIEGGSYNGKHYVLPWAT